MKQYLNKFGFVVLVATILNLVLIAAIRADDDSDIERIFFFGDSLSDTGNIFALTGQVTLPPWPLIPSAPYDFGKGVQFSDGPTWPLHFARRLDTRRSGEASLYDPGRNGNYAFGGARVSTGLADPTSGASQVERYLADFGDEADDDETLYVLQFGGNDLRDALLDPPNAFAITGQAVEAKLALIGQLHAAGARHFLVANVPNLGRAPAINFIGAAAPATGLSMIYNGLLEAGLQSLEGPEGLDGVRIDRLDLFGFLESIASDPAEFGIANVTDTCLMFLPPATGICEKPHKNLFWDGLHPTARVHKILGKQVAARYLDDNDDDDDSDD